MPIRFRCKCGQKLRVGDDKAGQRAKCPRCHASIHVPATSELSEEPAVSFANQLLTDERAVKEPAPAGALRLEEMEIASDKVKVENGLPEIVIRDDSADWDYETNSGAKQTETVIDYDKVAVSRRVLYLQGILLGVVALVSFVLGMLMSDRGPSDTAANGMAQPCLLKGHITYGHEEPRPDDGSVVIVLPIDRRPAADARVAIEGLRPGDPLPAEENISLRTIRSLGGDYARTNEHGMYQMRLPETGRYHVLVISRRSARSANDRLEMTDVAQIGRYFASVTDLIDDRKYRWQTLALRRDETLDATF